MTGPDRRDLGRMFNEVPELYDQVRPTAFEEWDDGGRRFDVLVAASAWRQAAAASGREPKGLQGPPRPVGTA